MAGLAGDKSGDTSVNEVQTQIPTNATAKEILVEEARDLALVKNDVEWIKRFQWWQLGLNVAQITAVALIASKVLGGPGPGEAATAVIHLFV
jgi:hypothetical protein